MADTFLNTGNTEMATSNVQANINQTNGQNVTNNPNINNTNGVQNANTQAVNPITIPIQIQPQIAGQNQIGQRITTKCSTKPKLASRKQSTNSRI